MESTEKKSLDIDKWNQIIFENANKYHTHQDNLRWLLSAGYVGFFYNGFKLTIDPSLVQHASMLIFVQASMTVLGTFFFLVVMMEGWYYNLMLAHLVKCEEDVIEQRNLITLAKFDRDDVPTFHPSFAFVLCAVAICNTFFLFQFLSREIGSVGAVGVAILYVALMLYLAIFWDMPKQIDVTTIEMQMKVHKKRVNRKRLSGD